MYRTKARKRIPQDGSRVHDCCFWWHQQNNWWHLKWWHLVALAVSLDGNGIKFGLGDNGNLSVEVDAKIENEFGDILLRQKVSLVTKIKTYSPVITTSGDWTQILAILFFSNLIILISWFRNQCYIVYFLLTKCWVIFKNLLWEVLIKPQSIVLLLQIINFNRDFNRGEPVLLVLDKY